MNYYWFFIKSVTILILISLYFDLEIFFFISTFIYLHIKNGVSAIIIDYIHDTNLSLIFNYLIKIIFIENTRYLVEILC